MCTVTYIPLNNKHYFLCSNRDEKHERSLAITPETRFINDQKVICPIDSKAEGTWIFTHKTLTACLLNGAYKKHESKKSYRKSRGKIVFDVLKYKDVHAFIENIDLEGIEPFTLVLVESKESLKLVELRWDEHKKHIHYLDPKETKVWSSATLYQTETIKERENLFQDCFNKEENRSEQNIVDFHCLGKEKEAKTPIFLRTETHKTVSTTLISNLAEKTSLKYLDHNTETESLCKLYDEKALIR